MRRSGSGSDFEGGEPQIWCTAAGRKSNREKQKKLWGRALQLIQSKYGGEPRERFGPNPPGAALLLVPLRDGPQEQFVAQRNPLHRVTHRQFLVRLPVAHIEGIRDDPRAWL